jgi:hypothetical protein
MIEVVEYDNRSANQDLVRAIERLASQDKVDLILPPWGTGANLAIAPLMAKFGYAATALVIDTSWYLIVAWLFSNPKWLTLLRQKAVWFERIFGAILIGLAGRLVLGILNGK